MSFFRQVAPGATLMYEDILYACDEDVCPEYTKDPRKFLRFPLPARLGPGTNFYVLKKELKRS